MRSFCYFILVSMSFGALPALGAGVDCARFESSIKAKIVDRFEKTKSINAGKDQCEPSEWGRVAGEFGRLMGSQCGEKVMKAVTTCGHIAYRIPSSTNAGQGAGDTSRTGTTTVDNATKDLRLQGKQCGRALQPVPRACRSAAKQAHDIIRQSNCGPAQIEQLQQQSMLKAEQGIRTFCEALKGHYEQTKANLKAQSAARENFKNTNKKTHRGK